MADHEPQPDSVDAAERLTWAIMKAIEGDSAIVAALEENGLSAPPRAAALAAEAAMIAIVAYTIGNMDERNSEPARAARKFALFHEDHANAAAGQRLRGWPYDPHRPQSHNNDH